MHIIMHTEFAAILYCAYIYGYKIIHSSDKRQVLMKQNKKQHNNS